MEIQIKDKKAAQITVVCLFFSLIGLAVFLGVKLVQWKDYVPVKATVESVFVSSGTDVHPNDRHTEVTYSFELNGKDYLARRVERFQSQSNVGKVRTIRCNPENPEMLEELWRRNGLIIILCGGTLILVLLSVGLHQQKKAAYRRPENESEYGDRSHYF